MELQFMHLITVDQRGKTIVFESSKYLKNYLLERIGEIAKDPENNSVIIRLGIARVAPEDKYCRRVGREISQKYINPCTCKITGVEYQERRIFIYLEHDDFGFVLSLHKNSDEVRSREVYFLW